MNSIHLSLWLKVLHFSFSGGNDDNNDDDDDKVNANAKNAKNDNDFDWKLCFFLKIIIYTLCVMQLSFLMGKSPWCWEKPAQTYTKHIYAIFIILAVQVCGELKN